MVPKKTSILDIGQRLVASFFKRVSYARHYGARTHILPVLDNGLRGILYDSFELGETQAP